MSVRIEIDAARVLNLAMVENAVPLVSRVSLTNTSEATIEEVVVEIAITPDVSAPHLVRVSALPPESTYHIDEPDLALDRDRLVNQLERSPAQLTVRARRASDGAEIGAATETVDVLAYNEWVATIPHLLAAYVQPNHPAVAELLRDARASLERLTRNPALDGYQSQSPSRAAAIAQAIYETIQQRRITYSNPPASFERTGQKIRTPEQIVTEQVGTCLDLTTLIAAALEQVGLYPLLVVIDGHAFPGLWLESTHIPEGLIDDRALVCKLFELGRVLVFDSSAVAHQPPIPFPEAVRRARKYLDDEDRFSHAVDVRGARQLGFLPLTMRVGKEYAAVAVPTPAASGPIVVRAPLDEARTRGASNRVRNPRVDAWKQKLLDTTLRNRLLNYHETKRAVRLACPDLGAVEDALASGEDFELRGRPGLSEGGDPRSRRLLENRLADGGPDTFLRERLAQRELYVDQSAETAASTLTHIYRGAREALEETGTNTLCLVLGMLDWYESDASEKKRRAPVLLLPVTLVRNLRAGTFTLRSTGEDARLNVTLFEKLRIDTGITLPELAELPLDQSGVDVVAVLNKVREAVINQRRWEVKDELHLGLFSFAKFQMWADLDQNLEAVLESPVVKHLIFGKGPYPNGGELVDPADIDKRFLPGDLLCPVDADASQLAAVVSATEGRTFVLQGPPGTGKSQTITNLIAHAMTQGKRVLFVAEKSAALEVVQRRLTQIGLTPYVLALHSHKSGKQEVLDQLAAALEAPAAATTADWEQETRAVHESRQRLNAYVQALHWRRAGGFSVFRALARSSQLRDTPSFDLPATCADSPERFRELLADVEALRLAATELAPVARSPWQGCHLPGWQVDLPSRVRTAIERSLAGLDALDAAGQRLAAALGTARPATLADVESLLNVAGLLGRAPAHGASLVAPTTWASTEPEAEELVALVESRSSARAKLAARYTDALFALDLPALATRFRALASAFFLIAWWGLRAAKKTLRPTVRDRFAPRAQVAADLELALATRDVEARLGTRASRGVEIFGALWSGTETDPGALRAALAWGRELHVAIARLRSGFQTALPVRSAELDAAESHARASLSSLYEAIDDLSALLSWNGRAELAQDPAPWAAVRERLERWRADLSRLRAWSAFSEASKRLDAAGCGAVAAAARRGELTPEQLHASFELSVYQAWLRRELPADPVLGVFDGDHHTRLVESFVTHDRGLIEACRAEAHKRIAVRAPAAAPGSAAGGEMAILQRELAKKRRQMPIRKLLAEIPSLVARLKPCFLMSPMSVAQYLDLRSATKFDLVVFDEASQIPTHDAVGVLARGTSAVIVGDSKQLPPTTFFSTTGDDEDAELEVEELESILDECVAAQFPERRLDWHYRSRHESLIAFSNHHYYQNRLNTFPSAAERGAGRGVWFREIVGVYDKGGSRTNKAEARAVVDELLQRLRAPDAANRTYGIVTFSKAQQTLIEDLLEEEQRKRPELASHFDESNAEPVIVRNLENIQGDERDVMLFSVCYGPDQNGKVSMNFGPLNLEGGERRLNVAVTRARHELVVFSTLLPRHIELRNTKSVGVKHLQTFLDYARRGPAAIAEALVVSGGDDFDSPFEQQVCERLRGRGFQVDTQVGCAGYRIDLGVRHPEDASRYVLAVECDGAYYHSARSARERDRLRAQVLRGLGWTIHRIWSTDWWQDPDGEIAKVLAAIERALRAPRIVDAPPPAAPPPRPARQPAVREVPSAVDSGPVSGRTAAAASVVPYVVAEVPTGRRAPEDVHDARWQSELASVLFDVVRTEAPVSLRVLAKRVAPYFGIARTSAKLETRLRTVLGGLRETTVRGDVVWRADQDPATFTLARLAPAEARREAQEIPFEEIANAAAGVLRANVALGHDELVRLTARALGFNRTGDKVASSMAGGIDLLLARGTARRDGDKVVLV